MWLDHDAMYHVLYNEIRLITEEQYRLAPDFSKEV